jgi:predicted nuclease with TOPRIM domain
MSFKGAYRFRIFCFTLLLSLGAIPGIAGVSRAIQEEYKRDYENKAMFLKIPIYSERQLVYISGQNIRFERGSGAPRYKVGDQLRVLQVDFAGDEIRLRLSGIAAPGLVEIGFKFDSNLPENFPNRDVFERALRSVLTEGLKYTEIEDAKRGFVEAQFERSIQEIAESGSISRDAVLKSVAPLVPAYRDAQRDIETLRDRVQDVSGQLSQAQSENRKLESESKTQQAELARLKSANAALQEKIDSSMTQVSRLGDELRSAKGTAQDYQKELASIQRSLNLKVDAGRDLSTQIADLGQALRKLQKDNGAMVQQTTLLRTSLDAQQAANVRLVKENEDLKASGHSMQSMIETLTSKEDSLASQYLNLKNEKEKLDDFSQAVGSLRTRIAEEKTEGGIYYGKADVYLRNVLLGSLDWSIPAYLNHGQSRNAEASFYAESIDYVRMTPEERHVLRSLGDRLRLRLDLSSGAATMPVTLGDGKPIRETGERDRSTWRWSVNNQGTQDSRLILTARLVNKDFNEIPLLQQEHSIAASNAVRQVRNYLKPIPLAVGVIIGFLLFGIVGIFRRHRTRDVSSNKSSAVRSESPSPPGPKQL